MKKILFVRREGVYLPEISAYMDYIKRNFPGIEASDSSLLNDRAAERDFDVVWKFMGFDRKRPSNAFLVHEYGSLSVGNFPKLKNLVKKLVNTRPDQRVFLNRNVCDEMAFRDTVPARLRDMGVSRHFFKDNDNKAEPRYDFVYAGSMNRGAVIWSMLNHFKENMPKSTLLVVGDVPEPIRESFGHVPNIRFTGRVAYEQVPEWIAQARYGLNVMPDRYPLNIQTSTKVLEYCAAGLPVVSTSYRWIREFEAESDAKFFYVRDTFDDLTLEKVERHSFKVPSVATYDWDNVIRQSGVFDFLK